MTPLECSFDRLDNGVSMVWLKGSADIANHDTLQQFLAPVAKSAELRIVVDVRNLNFLTSLAIGELLSLAKAKKQAGGKVTIFGPNEYVSGVFSMARLPAVIPVFATSEEAVAACKAN